MSIRVLTGITTSGTPHLGNYAGAIRPSIRASRQPGVDAFFFLADYHALVKCDRPERVARSRLEIAATWLAAGLDPDNVTFYRQSDIPEIPELCWLLSCVTAKGLMNRAHAYKAAVDANVERQIEPDDGVTMGLFSYPVLMAADILMFNANRVPVGRDQIQHLEMTRDIAQRFNHLYGAGEELFTLPDVQLDDDVAILPGLDGRKMSKSYDNTIPLFEGSAKTLRTAINRIVTDSRLPGEPKDADASHLYMLYQAFATREQAMDFREQLMAGLGWGEAKEMLFTCINQQIAPMRDRYQDLMKRPDDIEDILLAGAEKARSIARPFMARLRRAVGLCQTAQHVVQKHATPAHERAEGGRFVSFREDNGQFRFRLFDGDDTELFVSEAFADPKHCGYVMRSLQQGLDDDWLVQDHDSITLMFEGVAVCQFPADRIERVRESLSAMARQA